MAYKTWPKSLESSSTVYMCRVLAVAQTLVWFFVLPIICKPHWEWFWGLPFLAHPLAKQVLLNEMGFLYFAVACALMGPIYAGNYPFFEQFRITDRSNSGGTCSNFDWRSEKKEVRDKFWALTRRVYFCTSSTTASSSPS
jgi:hypothetical protein